MDRTAVRARSLVVVLAVTSLVMACGANGDAASSTTAVNDRSGTDTSVENGQDDELVADDGNTDELVADGGDTEELVADGGDTDRRWVDFDDVTGLCDLVTVDELAGMVQAEVRPPTSESETYEGTRYWSCHWDIGPEFTTGDNSDITVNINDRDFWDDPLLDLDRVSNFMARSAKFSDNYEVSLDMGGWTMGVGVYAGHNSAGAADPSFSAAVLEQFSALLIERIESAY